ncbi:HAD family hydrolase [Desulfobotulus mexicanus]|uniref:phosphoglycolate phosphatase n=1 Tax=Desulfobotulus mexicanus TaxID=2586642 RepID=A0A5S5ME87_9BACT|nr:HAD family hydrolase [Desulfobotulus mexicanus]TYT74032.1 HAD-IA family hydrolase [Desulfobotulus mexicanus]
MQIFKDISLVAFDCDGVMFDSSKANQTYYNTLLKNFDLPPMDEKDFHYVHMHTSATAIDYLFEGRVDLEKVREKQKNFHYPDLFPLMIEEPHLRKVLKILQTDFKTAVATNRSNTLRPLLDHFDLTKHFDMLITSMDVVRAKPWPDMLENLISYFGIGPENLIYIGDSPLDAQSASAAGCHFIGYGPKDLGAEVHITSLAGLPELLQPIK